MVGTGILIGLLLIAVAAEGIYLIADHHQLNKLRNHIRNTKPVITYTEKEG